MTESVKKLVVFAAATAVLVSAVLVNLYVLDVLVVRDLQETLVKVLSVIGISTVAVVVVMLLTHTVSGRK
jgi:hypothetical protein